MKKIVLISPYFGKLPNYFPLVLESMKKNKNITFLMLIDDKTEYDWSDNIKVIYTSFKNVQNLIQSKFEFPVSIKRPYKLCDYKPAYGYIFSEYIKEYDFWGHIDLDVIWGDLEKYITEDILEKYEFIYREGALRLYKNDPKINHLFEKDGSIFKYKEVFKNEESYGFDEALAIQRIAERNNIAIYENDNVVADINAFTTSLQIRRVAQKRWKDEAGIFRSIKNYKYQLFKWENGKIFRYYMENETIKKDEFMYIHLLKRKMKYSPDRKVTGKNESFIITPNKFIKDEELTVARLKQLAVVENVSRDRQEKKIGKVLRKCRRMVGMSRKQRSVTLRKRFYFILEKFVK